MDEFQRYREVSAAIGFTDFTPRLIQYNGLDGLKKMLASKELWFGDLAGMNDPTECDHFIDAISAKLGELFNGPQVAAIQDVLSEQKSKMKTSSYASSWCEYDEVTSPDRVVMWQCYGKNCPIGIVIDSSQFQPSAINAARLQFYVMSARINYIKPNSALETVNTDLRKLSCLSFLPDLLNDPRFIAQFLLAKAPCIKTSDFAHEQEIRFLFSEPLLALMQRQYPEQFFCSPEEGKKRRFLKSRSGIMQILTWISHGLATVSFRCGEIKITNTGARR